MKAVPKGPAGLHVARRGTGPTLLLAHGFAGSARNWGPQMRSFTDRYDVVTYDARGHARSSAPDDPQAYCEDALVRDLDSVRSSVGARAPFVGGLSMGAAVVLAWALRHPAKPSALVLAAFPPDPGSDLGLPALAFADAIEQEGVERAGARFAWGPESGLDPRGAALVRQGFLEHPPHALVHTLRGFLATRPALEEQRQALAALRIPTLVVVGARDRGSRPASETLARMLPEAELAVIPDAGHVVNLARPDAFNEVLAGFLERHASPPPARIDSAVPRPEG